MLRRSLVVLLLVAALVLMWLNLTMAAVSHRLPYRQKLEAIRTARDPNLLFIGNSLLDHHLDEGALAQTAEMHGVRYTPLNAALGASEPPEQRLLFEYATQEHPGIATLVVGFYDFQLTAPDHSHVADLLGNRMIGLDRRFATSEVTEAYGFGAKDRAELNLARMLPMAANRATAWKYVELLRRSMASIGMPKVATNSMGRVDDFAALEAGSAQVFDAQAKAFLANPQRFNASYQAIFSGARAAKMNVVLVVMPMSPYHLHLYYAQPVWTQYLHALDELAASRGIRVIDASAWLPEQSYFLDHLHMSPEGGHLFFERLGNELPQAEAR